MKSLFGRALRKLRKEQGIGLRMAAEQLGISAPYLSRIEQGKEPPPKPQIIQKVTALLGGGDNMFSLAQEIDPTLVRFINSNPSAIRFLRQTMEMGWEDKRFQELSARFIRPKPRKRGSQPSKGERHMSSTHSWPVIWAKFQENLRNEPKCIRHPNYPHVKSMAQGVVNDILLIETTSITIRSHRTNNVDIIPEDRFRTWWDHLEGHGSASLIPGDKNNPHPWRSRIVGAILASALPEKIEVEGSNSISLKDEIHL